MTTRENMESFARSFTHPNYTFPNPLILAESELFGTALPKTSSNDVFSSRFLLRRPLKLTNISFGLSLSLTPNENGFSATIAVFLVP